MPRARVAGLIGAAALLAANGEAATISRAGDGVAIPVEAVAAALASDNLVVELAAGERLDLADQALVAETDTRAMISLSTEFLTVAIAAGRARLESGENAGPGQALLIALDGTRPQRLSFNAARLSATLSPGARERIGADIDRLALAQRRAAFWGAWQPLRVNARAQGPAETEAQRQSYLAQPAIVAQRRAAAGRVSVAERGRLAVDAFLAAYGGGDGATLAALLDPAPFLALGGPAAVAEGRLRAAASLLADERLRAILAASPTVAMADDGGAAVIHSGGGRWRLALVPRDRAIFVQGLGPAS